jgi:tetratricopeptide (TPR) repeat protein
LRIHERTKIFLASILFSLILPLSGQEASPGADALLLYQRGRDLETANKTAEAEQSYRDAIAVCDAEIIANPARMDSYVVKSWCLHRLKRHQEVIATGLAALKQSTDYRIIEVMGEAYYHVDDMQSCLRYLQRYVDSVPENADRVSSAYFYMGEAYLRLKQYAHADIAYTIAVYKTPSMNKWWYRLGMAKEGSGDVDGAVQAYEKSLALNPSYAEAAQARDRLKAQGPR